MGTNAANKKLGMHLFIFFMSFNLDSEGGNNGDETASKC